MELTTIKLVTIIGPKALKAELVDFLKEAGISGYTYSYVFGGGGPLLSGTETEEAENVKLRVLMPHILSVTLMTFLSDKYFGKVKLITYEQDASVIRYDKFDKVEY